MFTLTIGLICMVAGYYLGTKETDKKWIKKLKDSGQDMVVYRDGTVETYKDGIKV